MAGLGDAFSNIGKKLVTDVVANTANGIANAGRKIVHDNVEQPIQDTVKGAGKKAQEGVTSVFRDNAGITAVLKDLPDKFDPRQSQSMQIGVEHLLVAAGAKNVSTDANLDGKDLSAYNALMLKQGQPPLNDWAEMKKDGLSQLLQAADSKPKQGRAVDNFQATVDEIKGGVTDIAAATKAAEPSALEKVGGWFKRQAATPTAPAPSPDNN